jgi:trehalose 6-phosphate synthase
VTRTAEPQATGGQDLVVVSNRGPLSFRLDDEGGLERADPGGGLAGTLQQVLAGTPTTWVATALGEADRRASAAGLMTDDTLCIELVDCEAEDYRLAYEVVSNATLWFCHHHLFDLPRRPRFDHRWGEAWDAYRQVNRAFADTVASVAAPGAAVLVQDYHLALTGAMLAAARPDLRTVHFSHTPFADPNVLRTLPSDSSGELLAGMAGFGSCGFHTDRWATAFGRCFADAELSTFAGTSAAPPVFAAPLGVDTAALLATAQSEDCRQAAAELDEMVGERKLMVRVDRVELSKNLLRGFWAYDEFLETRPQWRGGVVFLALAYPSRERLADYLAYRSEVEHTVARINDRWGTPDWTPIVLDVADDRFRSMAALTRYDVLLVNPVRDGLNLVAKEGPVVNQRHGVLVLSREAGAWEELQSAAFGINPFDLTATARAIESALDMDEDERRQRSVTLRDRCTARSTDDWLRDQLTAADSGGATSGT